VVATGVADGGARKQNNQISRDTRKQYEKKVGRLKINSKGTFKGAKGGGGELMDFADV